MKKSLFFILIFALLFLTSCKKAVDVGGGPSPSPNATAFELPDTEFAQYYAKEAMGIAEKDFGVYNAEKDISLYMGMEMEEVLNKFMQ